MKKSRFTDEQIIGFMRQAEAGMPIKELYRSGGFSDASFYKWRAKYGGMQSENVGKLLTGAICGVLQESGLSRPRPQTAAGKAPETSANLSRLQRCPT